MRKRAQHGAICWPSRYLLRCAAVFLGACLLGAILAVYRRPKPPPPPPAQTEVQATVVVLAVSPDNPSGAPAKARIYVDAKTRAEIRAGDVFVINGTGKKRLMSGPRDFMVQLLAKNDRPLTEPLHRHVEWPKTPDQTVTLRVELPKKPDSASGNEKKRTNGEAPGRPYWVDSPLREEDIPNDRERIRAMINELFAAAGYRFQDARWRTLFEKKGYRLTIGDQNAAAARMTPVQQANRRRLEQRRDSL